MSNELNGMRIAILATDGFEEVELSSPKAALLEAGATVEVIAPEKRAIRAWAETDWGENYEVDKALDEADASDYRALVLPGGLFNPDNLRADEQALTFVRHFFEAGKPVGAICHAPWIMINAGVVEGRKLTSVPTIAQDLKNAGANWVDEEVVVDSGLVTSRTPKDLEAFCSKLIEEIGEGKHRGQHA
ncbi:MULTISPECIES: type 1 glutamine amidotransferase domain-containing protein [Halomonadaceae]|uniref:type 1 glutamine amidotransferase domain-containing protein n=1 Tax=Halomonadaceae TaxID=28256 RepID=UPI001599C42F|nr:MULTISPECIES: type 1 glutamine amidotransferase domain-containing protein [Halomonas]QJQ94995.1 type 1 glutamine amidotransferase [Halomonas sp. PA5]